MDAKTRTSFYALLVLAAAFLARPAEAKYIGGMRPIAQPSAKPAPCSACDNRTNNALANTPSGTSTSLSESNFKETYPGPSITSSTGSIGLNLNYDSSNASGNQARVLTTLGVGWTHSYNVFLFQQRTEFFRYDGDGRVTKYSPVSPTEYRSTEGYFETLTRTGPGSFTLTQQDGTAYDFALVSGSPTLNGMSLFWLQRITDRAGNIVVQLSYSGGLLTSITDTFGRSLTLGYTNGKLTSLTDPNLKTTHLEYDGTRTRLTKITDPSEPVGKTVTYTYDSLYQITRKVDRANNTFRFGYRVDRPISATDGTGASLFGQNNPDNWATDPEALATRLMREYKPSTTSRTDGNGRVWKYTYDSGGYLTKIVGPAPENATTEYTYDPASLKVSRIVDANGHCTDYGYDPDNGNLTLEQVHKEENCKDPNVPKVTFDTGYTYCNPALVDSQCPFTLPIYDRVKTITYPNGSKTEYQYDLLGNRKTEIRDVGGLNLTTRWTYYAANELPGNPTPAKNLVKTEEKTNVTPGGTVVQITRYEYGTDGNPIRMTDPEGHQTRYFYDEVGNRKCTVDGNGHVRLNLYDGLNRVTDEIARIGEQVGPTDPLAPVCDADPPFDDQDLKLAHYEYDGNGNRVLMQRQANTATPRVFQNTSYDYDPRNRLAQEIRDPGGLNLVTAYAYDRNDNRTRMTDPRGKATNYAYDGQNRLTKVTDAVLNVTQTRYDPVGNRTCVIDANGHDTFYEYDALNRQSRETRKIGSQSCTTADANDILTQTFYDAGNPIPPADCKNSQCEGPIPGSSSPASMIDPENKFTYFKYDAVNRPVMTLRKVNDTADSFDANDWSQITQYDTVGNVLARFDANGNPTTYTYFDDNLVETEANATGDTTRYTYDATHNVRSVQSPRGNVTRNVYDERNQLIQVADLVNGPGSLVARYAYDGIGNRVQECDGNDHCTEYSYDAVNRLVDTVDPLGNTALNGYDKNGNLIKATDRENHVTCHYYDDINRRTRTAQLMGGSNCAVLSASDLWTDTEYDAVGNVTRLITAKKNATPDACKGASPPEDCEITSYQYDPADRLVLETYADETTRQFEYDKSGNLHQRTDQLGQVTQYIYNDLYYLMQRDYLDGAEPDDAFEYDTGGRMIRAERATWVVTYNYDAANRVVQTAQDATGAPMTVQYAYNTAAGTRDLIYPVGRHCHEQRDLRERLVDNACDSFAGTYAYDLGNRVLTRTYNNGVAAHYGYDADNRITSLTHTNGGTVADFGYDYDKEGNKKFENKNHDPAKSEAYAYDDVYRLIDYKVGTLVGSTVPAPITQTQYDLDKVGNWDQFTQDDDGAGPGVPIVYQNTPNQMNEYDDPSTNGPGEIPDDLGIPNNFKDLAATPAPDGENWAHDKNGNRREDGKRIYVYDDENRLIRVTRKLDAVQTDYRYDALSRRVVKAINGGATTRYAYDDARIVEEQDPGGVTQATYVYGNYIDEVLNMQRGGADYYYHQNALWSVVAITNASAVVVERYDYTDYGCPSVTTSAIGNPWRFTGRQWDEESGLYFYRARYYDCEGGRFLQRDLLGYLSALNLYEYLFDSPLNLIDPYGLQPWQNFPGIYGPYRHEGYAAEAFVKKYYANQPQQLRQWAERPLPNLKPGEWIARGLPTEVYNCIGYACGIPMPIFNQVDQVGFGGNGNGKVEVVDFDGLFKKIGFIESKTCDPECMKRKIALFAKAGDPRHAAREVVDGGWWESKLGPGPLILHRLTQLEGSEYGNIIKCYEKADRTANLHLCVCRSNSAPSRANFTPSQKNGGKTPSNERSVRGWHDRIRVPIGSGYIGPYDSEGRELIYE